MALLLGVDVVVGPAGPRHGIRAARDRGHRQAVRVRARDHRSHRRRARAARRHVGRRRARPRDQEVQGQQADPRGGKPVTIDSSPRRRAPTRFSAPRTAATATRTMTGTLVVESKTKPEGWLDRPMTTRHDALAVLPQRSRAALPAATRSSATSPARHPTSNRRSPASSATSSTPTDSAGRAACTVPQRAGRAVRRQSQSRRRHRLCAARRTSRARNKPGAIRVIPAIPTTAISSRRSKARRASSASACRERRAVPDAGQIAIIRRWIRARRAQQLRLVEDTLVRRSL